MTLSELKKHAGSKKLIIGKDRVLKMLRKNNIKEIFLSANCGPDTLEDVESFAKKFDVKISRLKITNDDMGVVVKKPFAVSIAGLQR